MIAPAPVRHAASALHTNTYTPNNSAYFSRLTLVLADLHSCYYKHVSSNKVYLRLMNDRGMFGFPEVNDLSVTACVISPLSEEVFFSATN